MHPDRADLSQSVSEVIPMDTKRVRTIEEIVFDSVNPPEVLPKGGEYCVEAVLENGIILYTDDGDRFMIDLDTFEAGFEAIG